MSTPLSARLDQILPRITSKDFLSGEGIGNEIACYIFEYPAKDELIVRDHLEGMLKRLESHHKEVRVMNLNLLKVVVAYLEQRSLLGKAVEMQAAKGDSAVLRALKGPLSAEKLAGFIATNHSPLDADLVLLSGVGGIWPMLRIHSLLNWLHPVMGTTPLVLFYPGKFDGTTLRLFDQVPAPANQPGTKPYYRAFNLIPEDTDA